MPLESFTNTHFFYGSQESEDKLMGNNKHIFDMFGSNLNKTCCSGYQNTALTSTCLCQRHNKSTRHGHTLLQAEGRGRNRLDLCEIVMKQTTGKNVIIMNLFRVGFLCIVTVSAMLRKLVL